MNNLHRFDLVAVSLWALFVIWNPEGGLPLMLPFIVLRLAINFSLQLHRRKSAILIGAFALAALSALTMNAWELDDWILNPFAKMYDSIIMLFTGQSTLLTGAYHFLGHHGDAVPDPGYGWRIFTAIWIAWLVGEPIAVYCCLMLKKRLTPSKWSWKKTGAAIALYAFFTSSIFIIAELYFPYSNAVGKLWLISLLLIPLIARINRSDLSTYAIRYLQFAALFGVAFFAGFSMDVWFSLFAMWAAVCGFFYLVSRRRDFRPYYVLSIAVAFFWGAQFLYGIPRIMMILSSSGMFAMAGYVHYSMTKRSKTESVSLAIVCGIILPSISLGYNQYVCIGTGRIANYDDYHYSYRGLLIVGNDDDYGIRDRFGYIMPCEYSHIESLGDRSKPFVKFKRGNACGVYDLERQETVLSPDSTYIRYTDITPFGKHAWRLVNEEGEGYGYDKFFVVSSYYSHHRPKDSYSYSEYPYMTKLGDYLLKCDYRISNAEDLDCLLADMMQSVSQKEDSVPEADFYWEWTADLTLKIDRLHEQRNMFSDIDDLYDNAMEAIEQYIEPSFFTCSQCELNNGSYVQAIAGRYRMTRKNRELADSVPYADMRKEYTLFCEYLDAYEDLQNKLDAPNRGYSDKPRQTNVAALNRYNKRRSALENMLSVIAGDTVIPPHPKVSLHTINGYFSSLAADDDETRGMALALKDKFFEWMRCREEIAAEMPADLAVSYRNQTEHLKHFYTSSEFTAHDGF